jgi:hypothetical protein
MTVYTTLPTDDLNLAVTVIDDPDLVVLNITPAAVNVTSAVTSVNNLVGNVTLTTDEIPESSNLYYTDARADARVDLQTGANLDLSFMDTDDLAEGPTNLYSKQPNSTTDDVTFNSVTADMFGVQHFTAKARETITAGQPVYISGHSGNTPEVMVADYTDPAKMPAFGIASADIANNNNGSISTYGDLKNVDTTGTTEGETWAVGDVLYVDGSNLTNVRPSSETQAVQSLAKVIRVHANNGQMFLSGAGRVNDVPNLDHYHVFIGNAGGVEKRQLNYNTDILNTPSLTAYITASSTDTLTNKSGNISQWTNDAGYLTTETDNQTLTFATPDLSISSGNSVNLTPLITGLITASSTDTLTNKSGSNSQWTNTEAYIKADSTDTLTNKSGSNNQWTNDAGYITSSALTPYYTSTQVDALPVSTFTNDAGYITEAEDNQTLSFVSPDLTISGSLSSVDLSALTDGGTY